MKLKEIIVVVLIVLSSNVLSAQQESNVPVKDVSIDSTTKKVIEDVLLKNSQRKTYKAFGDSTAQHYDLQLMQQFFSNRRNKDVRNVDDYNLFLTKLDSLIYEKADLTNNIENFLMDNKTFMVVSQPLREEFVAKLKSRSKTTRSVDLPKANNNLDSIHLSTNRPESLVTIRPWSNLIWFGFGMVFIGFIWLIKGFLDDKKRKVESRKIEDQENMNRKLKHISDEFEIKYNKLLVKYNELKTKLNRAEDTITELNKLKELPAKTFEKSPELPISPPTQQKAIRKYFSSPLMDGSFMHSDGQDSFSLGASVYCFMLKSDQEAEFEFCEDPSSISMALNNRTDLILTVAEEKEGNAFNARGISTYNGNVGKAKLANDKWIVVEKLQIKYN